MTTLRLPSPYIPHKPEPKQAAFLLYDGLEAFYGGAAAGGKSEALLMAALQYVNEPDYAAMLFRRTYADLALPGALMDRAASWLSDTPARWDREKHTWHFPSGASLSFGYVQTDKDKWRYQSAELQFIGWDEVTEFPPNRGGEANDAYVFMFSRLRRLKNSEVPLRVRCASNPVGIGAGWVKKRFVEEGPQRKGIFIPANFEDNTHIDRDAYFTSLQELPETTQARLIAGSWDEIEDAAFPEFNEDINIIDPIAVPSDWRRWEGMDFGVSNPTAWLAAGMAPTSHIVVYGEYYRPGLISQTASAILTARENRWGQPQIALCDPAIKAATGFGQQGRAQSVHTEFSKHGIYLVPANNDRMAGRVRISELLRPDPSLAFPEWHHLRGEMGSPRLFFTSNCENTIEQIGNARLDEAAGEIVDPYWEGRSGHAMAALRYLLTARIVKPDVYGQAAEGRLVTGRWKEWREWSESLEYWKAL